MASDRTRQAKGTGHYPIFNSPLLAAATLAFLEEQPVASS